MSFDLTQNRLESLAAIADRLGDVEIAAEARSLALRIVEGRFYLACVGQFKRGKSTLLDALLGEPLLPIGVLPITSVPTIVRYGPRRAARVSIGGGAWQMIDASAVHEYVTEAENPENRKGVSAVEVFVPNTILADGLSLVDTPGIGSVFEANTSATRRFIPHIDAALVVLGADPPITREELSLVVSLRLDVPEMIFVLNKADKTSPPDSSAAIEFAGKLLAGHLHEPVQIFEVSAKERLEHADESRDWQLFETAVRQLASDSGRLVQQAEAKGTIRLLSWLNRTTSDRRAALIGPTGELERRTGMLARFIIDAERSLADLGLLMTGEQLRLARGLSERRRAFQETARLRALSELESRSPTQVRWGPAYRRKTMRAAQDIARALVIPWLAEEQRFAEGAYVKLRDRFSGLANEFLFRLADSGVPELAHFESALPEGFSSSSRSRFQFHDLIWVAQPASPLRYLADAALAASGARRLILRDAERFLEQLLEINTSRVQYDIEEQLDCERKTLEKKLRQLLHQTMSAAERGLARVLEVKAAGEPAVNAELESLKAAEDDLEGLFRGRFGGEDLPGSGDVH